MTKDTERADEDASKVDKRADVDFAKDTERVDDNRAESRDDYTNIFH